MNTASPPTTAPHSILAAGEVVAQDQLRAGWDSPQIQRILFTARQRFGHALCSCRPSHLKLQIRLREGKCHLAVWPQEHPAHDSECLFFRDEVADRATGVAALREAITPALLSTPDPSQPPSAAERPRIALTLRFQSAPLGGGAEVTAMSLANRMWEAADLCRWHPSWNRDWGRARYQLMRAATEFTLNGQDLEKLLFVPRPYRESQADSLNQAWDDFVRALRLHASVGPRLLIAPVRRFSQATESHGPTVLLRHLRAPIGLTHGCFDFLMANCRNTLSNSALGGVGPQDAHATAQRKQSHRPEVMGFFLVEASSRGGVWARAGWLMAVHPANFVPASNSNRVMLIDQLVDKGYAFQHLMSDAQPMRRSTPDLLVRHVRGPEGVPVARAALEVMSASVSEQYRAARAAIAQAMANQGIPTWTWITPGRKADRRLPPLPPLDQVDPQAAALVLKQISQSPDADYRYGPSNKFSSTERKPS